MMSFGDPIIICVLILTISGPLGSIGQTCGGTLNKDSPTRNITSPDYPDRLSEGITCEWIIEAPMGQVQLQFEVFNFPPTVFGCFSAMPAVSIYNGSSTSSPSLEQYCGDELGNYAPPDVILLSSAESLLVHFSSGNSVGLLSGQGFVATFSFPDTVDDCASSPCTNGGTCVDGHRIFQCLCTPEYVGTQCQVLRSSCLLPLGMANGDIEDNQISASTEKAGYEAYKGRINGPRAWQPDVVNTNQWLQVNFNNRTIITGIQTQGLWGGHVKSYRLLYGDTEDGLSVVKETGSDRGKVFDANSDGSAVVSHGLDLPIIASILRVNPQDFTTNLIRLRIELLGCEDAVTSGSTQPETTTLTITTALPTTASTSHADTTKDVYIRDTVNYNNETVYSTCINNTCGENCRDNNRSTSCRYIRDTIRYNNETAHSTYINNAYGGNCIGNSSITSDKFSYDSNINDTYGRNYRNYNKCTSDNFCVNDSSIVESYRDNNDSDT
ncbi:DCBLD2 [Branchiostoma lanceolatum]|uniref:DCBLD2 protein n=1 Tax=Branchiostoma lanceolatum TaxID=7740 RepID=A0A8K0A133_BRALA|nr:DCBLD2 [Branchiostoma lanceolatum]